MIAAATSIVTANVAASVRVAALVCPIFRRLVMPISLTVNPSFLVSQEVHCPQAYMSYRYQI